MKKIVVLLVCLVTIFTSLQATVFTVSNMPFRPAQFTTINNAISVAINGDTIYVMPGNYAASIINKELTLIGPGFKSENYPGEVASTLFQIQANNVNIIGFSFQDMIDINSHNNIIIERNKWQLFDTVPFINAGDKLIFRNNYLYFDKSSTPVPLFNISGRHIFIEYNVIVLNPNGKGLSLLKLSNALDTVYFDGNLVNVISFGLLSGISGNPNSVTIFLTNNIFETAPGFFEKGIGGIYINNISYSAPILNAGSDFGNIQTNNPISFINKSGDSNGLSNGYDFHISSGSPGDNAALDGTDMGPGGGLFPMVDGITNQSNLPYVSNLTLNNHSVSQGTNINATITGKKHD